MNSNNKERQATPTRLTNWSQATDSQLIEACLAGHESAWTALIDRYSRLIYTIPLRFDFPKVVADEVFQETCLILLERLDTLRNWQRISSWLMTVTRRVCIQRLRRKSVDTYEFQEGDHAIDSSIEEALLRLEKQQLVQQALGNLQDRDQQLLRALFFEVPRRSYKEIAEELQVSEGSVGPLRARSLERLRQEILRLEQVLQ